MCGLAGIFGDGARQAGLLKAMATTIAHRGPDDEGGREVEHRRPDDRGDRAEDPRPDDRGDRVRGIVEAVDEVECERDEDDADDVRSHALTNS